MPTQSVPIASIDIPKKMRPIKKKVVEQLAMSLELDGLLHPIGLRPAAKEGRYTLVFGRHRLEGAKKSGWDKIEATVFEIEDDAAEAASNAENLFRNGLTPADKALALKSWSEKYLAKHPEARQGKAGGRAFKAKKDAEKTGEPAPDAPTVPAFAELVSEQTGIDPTTVREFVAVGKKLSDEELGILSERGVPMVHIQALAKLPDEAKAKALAMIASGLKPHEAIATATLPANATVEQVGDPTETPLGEADMSDDEWLGTYCGEVLDRLKDPIAYRNDALVYRHTREARQTLKDATKRTLQRSKIQRFGQFHSMFTRFLNVDHPSSWLPCGPCGGTGMSGDEVRCDSCRGHGFGVTYKNGGR